MVHPVCVLNHILVVGAAPRLDGGTRSHSGETEEGDVYRMRARAREQFCRHQ